MEWEFFFLKILISVGIILFSISFHRFICSFLCSNPRFGPDWEKNLIWFYVLSFNLFYFRLVQISLRTLWISRESPFSSTNTYQVTYIYLFESHSSTFFSGCHFSSPLRYLFYSQVCKFPFYFSLPLKINWIKSLPLKIYKTNAIKSPLHLIILISLISPLQSRF